MYQHFYLLAGLLLPHTAALAEDIVVHVVAAGGSTVEYVYRCNITLIAMDLDRKQNNYTWINNDIIGTQVVEGGEGGALTHHNSA